MNSTISRISTYFTLLLLLTVAITAIFVEM